MPSIEFVVGVAVGGRASLLGPVLGTIAVAWARTALSERLPGGWIYLEGALFVLVLSFLPAGLASLVGRRRRSGDVPGPVPIPPVSRPGRVGAGVGEVARRDPEGPGQTAAEVGV
jgi:urea transport system permease protein